MRNLIALLTLLTACGSAPSKIAKVPELPSCADAQIGQSCIPSPAEIAPAARVVQGEDWSIKLPAAYETKRMPTLVPEGVSVKAFADKTTVRLIVLMREEDNYSKKTEGVYVERFIHQMTDGGAVVVGAVDQVMIDEKFFSKVEINKDGIKMFVFVHVHAGIAHVIMCGGRIADTQVETVCRGMVDTFKMD